MSLTNTQYNAIFRKYDAKQLENQHIVSQRIEYVYKEIPRLQEIDDTIASISVTQAKKLLDGDSSASEALKAQIQQLTTEKEELMRSHGYPKDYFTPPYTCPDCKDTGYIGNEKCHCFKQAEIDFVYTQSNIKRILEKENFQNFSFDYYSDQADQVNPSTGLTSLATAKQAVKDCKDFIQHFHKTNKPFQNLLLCGETGTGKTFLSNCVAKELLDQGYSVIYLTCFELLEILESNTFSKESLDSEHYQNIFDCDLLIVDDLGAELSNSFTNSQLFLCLNERILRQRSTIISTNLNLNQLAQTYSERIFSRIASSYKMIQLFGDDIRIQKKLRR